MILETAFENSLRLPCGRQPEHFNGCVSYGDPEAHHNDHQAPATPELMADFALVMVLDTALG